jgi:hypothetical protein
MSEPFFVTPEVAPSALTVVGEKITVLARGERTGSYEVSCKAAPRASARRSIRIRGTRHIS